MQPQAFQERVTYFINIAFISLHEEGSDLVWLRAADLETIFKLGSIKDLLESDPWLDQLNDYHRETGLFGMRWITPPNDSNQTLILAVNFLERPAVKILWDSLLRRLGHSPATPAKKEPDEFAVLYDKDFWSETDFSRMLALVFINYHVPGQRTTSVTLLASLAYDARTPLAWAIRLDWLIQEAARTNQAEIHLRALTQAEHHRRKIMRRPPPFTDTSFA